MQVAVKPSDLPDWLIAQGRHFVTSEEVAELLGVDPGSVRQSLRRPAAAKKIVSVTNGAWVPVPPEHRRNAAPPPAHYIDALMGFLGHRYYVGFLTAAAIHGASHQASMVFQVVTSAALRDRKMGTAELRFVRRRQAALRPAIDHLVPTGRIKVSTTAVTMLDLVGSPNRGGGLSNVATVIAQFAEDGLIEPSELASAAATYPRAVIQRAGHLIDSMSAIVGVQTDLAELERTVADSTPVALLPSAHTTGPLDDRWRVSVNVEIEPDL